MVKSRQLGRISIIWAVLMILTLLQSLSGAATGIGQTQHIPVSLAVLAVAVFKVRLVGLYFMELRQAPPALRGGFEGYCLMLLALLAGMYLWG